MTIVGMTSTAPLGPRAVDPLSTGQLPDVGAAFAPRQCGRCRGLLEGSLLEVSATAGWWLCDACRISIRPDRDRSAT